MRTWLTCSSSKDCLQYKASQGCSIHRCLLSTYWEWVKEFLSTLAVCSEPEFVLLLLCFGRTSFHSFFFFKRLLKPCKVSITMMSWPRTQLQSQSMNDRFCKPSVWWFLHHSMNVMELVFKGLFFLTGDFAWLTYGYRKISQLPLSESNLIICLWFGTLQMINSPWEWGHCFEKNVCLVFYFGT